MCADRNLNGILYDFYGEELKEYREILVYTKKQTHFIKENDFDSLENIIRQKDNAIKNIDEIERKLKPYKEAICKKYQIDEKKWFSDFLEGKDFKQYIADELRLLIQDLVGIVKQTYNIDQANRQLMIKKRQVLAEDMLKIKKGIIANNNYNKKVKIYSTFIDKKG